jgi:hypothetical protein
MLGKPYTMAQKWWISTAITVEKECDMEGGKLIVHAGALRTDREGLRALPTPEGNETWRPIPHIALVEAIAGEIVHRGMAIKKEEFAIQKETLFGVIDLDWNDNGEYAAAVGIRHSNDKKFAATICVAAKVTICDNLLYYSSLIPLKKKHTPTLNLRVVMIEAFDRYMVQYPKLQENVAWWKERTVSKERGKQLIYDVFSQRLVPLRLFHPACRDWEAQENKTMWTLQNSISNHVKTLKPSPAFTATLKLSRFFEKVG